MFNLTPMTGLTARSFDDIFKIFEEDFFNDRINKISVNSKYPPTDIYASEDGSISIEMLVSGFDKENLDVRLYDNTIVIKGDVSEEEETSTRKVLSKGINIKAFEKVYSFKRADFDVDNIEVKCENGILYINMPVAKEKEQKYIKFDF